jgi:hypothetical protein
MIRTGCRLLLQLEQSTDLSRAFDGAEVDGAEFEIAVTQQQGPEMPVAGGERGDRTDSGACHGDAVT